MEAESFLVSLFEEVRERQIFSSAVSGREEYRFPGEKIPGQIGGWWVVPCKGRNDKVLRIQADIPAGEKLLVGLGSESQKGPISV